MLLSLIACRGENDPEYDNSVKVSTFISSTTVHDLTIDVYRTTYNGYVVYETYYSHTQDYMIYYFSYKLQLLDDKGLIMVESPVLTVDKPNIYAIYQGLSIPVNDPNWIPVPQVIINLTINDGMVPQ